MSHLIPKYLSEAMEQKLFEIENAIRINIPKYDRVGVLDGKSGIALFYYWLYRYTNKDEYIDICIDIVYEEVEKIGKSRMDTYFFNGLAGIVWLVEYLINKNVFEKSDSILNSTRHILLSNADTALHHNNYELMSGAIGYMMPFIQSKDEKELGHFVNKLFEKAESNNKTLKWKSIDFNDNSEMYCFGLAHGMSGIVRVTSKLINQELIDNKYIKNLEEVSNFYSDTIEKQFSKNSLLPNWIKSKTIDNEIGRLAWCHGDLGAGIGFLNSGLDTGSEQLLNMGNKLLSKTARRKDLKLENIIDTCLCHGTAGFSHIYYKAYCRTQIESYLETSLYWFDKTLKMAKHNNTYAGYLFHVGEQGWTKSINILNGIAGTGLTILSMLHSENIDWDECLLLN
ncbi:MAG: hypothetical protein JEY96_08920 [Bacteroidales bacterium]|nr:hypothetical protein [Bacteroidales bacterium]